MKKEQLQIQTQTQAQQAKPLEGGAAMKKEQLQIQQQIQQPTQQQQTRKENEAGLYFITFPTRVDNETARQVLAELRKRFPGTAIFAPRPPRGRKKIMEIADVTVIITFPYTLKNSDKQEQSPQSPESPSGFTLAELIKKK